MIPGLLHPLRNGEAILRSQVPELTHEEFRESIVLACEDGARIVALFGQPEGSVSVRLFGVLAFEAQGQLAVCSTQVADAYPALTPVCVQAQGFEREIAEQWGLRPEGHPWLKPIRSHPSYRPGRNAWNRSAADPIQPGTVDFFKFNGQEVHEVAVGPIHAGIIEPGHFRFQCHGEQVCHLEIALGYQHRGIERAMIGGPGKRSVFYMETAAGDTSIGHSLAYCEGLETLAGCTVPARGQFLRAAALELERLANHTGDLGALAGDVGYLPTASYCGRIRGDFLNLTALLCGNRFGRGLVRPGGSAFDLDEPRRLLLLEKLDSARRDVTSAVELLWESSSVRSRFENAGAISRQTALELGMVGVAARASGIERDDRSQFPSGLYRFAQIPVSSYHAGTVFARAYVRWLEIQRSLAFLSEQLTALPEGPVRVQPAAPAGNSFVVSLVEGWRGEICHVALTGEPGRIAHYKVVDPSFHNWMGLAQAMREQQISDFPIVNKSFNLSYCGHDL